jgi:hypothetical protein
MRSRLLAAKTANRTWPYSRAEVSGRRENSAQALTMSSARRVRMFFLRERDREVPRISAIRVQGAYLG